MAGGKNITNDRYGGAKTLRYWDINRQNSLGTLHFTKVNGDPPVILLHDQEKLATNGESDVNGTSRVGVKVPRFVAVSWEKESKIEKFTISPTVIEIACYFPRVETSVRYGRRISLATSSVLRSVQCLPAGKRQDTCLPPRHLCHMRRWWSDEGEEQYQMLSM